MRDIFKEFIRESIFENISDEIPYETDVLMNKVDKEVMDHAWLFRLGRRGHFQAKKCWKSKR